ncbi:MAG: PHP domain-containing protein [Leptolyngbyaceae cyanobacterium MO_188.B28]|nr:PHP domain-containing protein [Leptolyngbyaceae cyanobacterium MO_188.B28]
MHTTCSDGRLGPDEVMQQAIALDLRGLAITDHHTVEGYVQASAWMEDWRWRNPTSVSKGDFSTECLHNTLPHLWIGVEINALLLDVEVHILGYSFSPNHPAIQRYLQGGAAQRYERQAEKVIAAIQAAGGIAILAHPARYRRPAPDLIPEAVRLGIDGVETYYAYDNPAVWRPSPQQTKAIKRLADRHELLSTCGTDTHGLTLRRRL